MSVVKRRIGPADHGRFMTLDKSLEAGEEPGYRYELARGVLEVSEVPDVPVSVPGRRYEWASLAGLPAPPARSASPGQILPSSGPRSSPCLPGARGHGPIYLPPIE
jgi:hypothetical protein